MFLQILHFPNEETFVCWLLLAKFIINTKKEETYVADLVVTVKVDVF